MKTKTKVERNNNGESIINGEVHVWSIHDNAYVTLDYWLWVNGRKK